MSDQDFTAEEGAKARDRTMDPMGLDHAKEEAKAEAKAAPRKKAEKVNPEPVPAQVANLHPDVRAAIEGED